jgi:hypothetical protein
VDVENVLESATPQPNPILMACKVFLKKKDEIQLFPPISRELKSFYPGKIILTRKKQINV